MAYPDVSGGTVPIAFPTNDVATVKVWSRQVEREALPKTLLNTFLQAGIIERKTDLTRGPGDELRYTLTNLLSGAGRIQNAPLTGVAFGDDGLNTVANEEATQYTTDSITINQLRHAVRWYNNIDQQRVVMNMRSDSRDGLADWWADRLDDWMLNQLASDHALFEATPVLEDGLNSALKYTGMNLTTVPDADHHIAYNTSKVTLNLLEDMVTKAKTMQDEKGLPILRPVRIAGGEYFVVVMHSYSWRDLRLDSDWQDIQKSAMSGGLISENPIFTGSAGVYGSCIIFESSRMPGVPAVGADGTYTANQKRVILLGKGAGCLAEGRGYNGLRFNWNEDSYDGGNEQVITSGLIAGLKKTRFGPEGSEYDYGVITADVWANEDYKAVAA